MNQRTIGGIHVRTLNRTTANVALLLAAALTAAACGDDSKSSTSTPVTATPGPTTSQGAGTSATATTAEVVAGPSRGFDGTTITVGGIGFGQTYAGAEIGAEARFKRANDTNELNGIKIKFTDFADDKNDPATATAETRRLVTQEKVFAIVPDMSSVNAGPYLTGEKVPYVGFATDNTYCSKTPTTELWGFGIVGCLTSADPPVMPDFYSGLYDIVKQTTGKASPSMVIFSSDGETGQNTARFQSASAGGAGFNVVYAKGVVPVTVTDYSPYITQWLRADNGKAPDMINCVMGVQCITVWNALHTVGYSGVFFSALGALDQLAKPLAGTYSSAAYNTAPSPALTQLEKDLEAFKPGAKPVGYSNVLAYFSADMFIEALKKIGKNITPDALQKALATNTWQIEGLVGPTHYPAATVVSTPYCFELIRYKDDGSGFDIVNPYSCHDKQFPVGAKPAG
jgi:ABC-type branched-subunit amino acid transport system substrate-binding protein